MEGHLGSDSSFSGGVPGLPESKGKAEKLEYTKQCDDCCFLQVIFVHWHLIITFVQISLGEHCGTRDSGGNLRYWEDIKGQGRWQCLNSSNLCKGAICHLSSLPCAKEVLQGELDWWIIPAFSMAENSAWTEASFSGGRG